MKFRDQGIENNAEKPHGAWSFKQPLYDQRSSVYIEAGRDHGTGYRTPVGTKDLKPKPDAVPYGRVDTLNVEAREKEWPLKGSSYRKH